MRYYPILCLALMMQSTKADIIIYPEANNTGRSNRVPVHSMCLDFAPQWQDQIKSIDTGSHCIELCEHRSFEGKCIKTLPGLPNTQQVAEVIILGLSSFRECNDTVSNSVSNNSPGGRASDIEIYDSPEFSGEKAVLPWNFNCITFSHKWQSRVNSISTNLQCILLCPTTSCTDNCLKVNILNKIPNSQKFGIENVYTILPTGISSIKPCEDANTNNHPAATHPPTTWNPSTDRTILGKDETFWQCLIQYVFSSYSTV